LLSAPAGTGNGPVSADVSTLTWDNGGLWTRLPPSASKLDRWTAYWESRTFYCPSIASLFPSKEGAPCDDGDSIMFNALLCRMGDPRGCHAVKLSQTTDPSLGDFGRFWRSPEQQRLRPQEPPGLKDGQTTFSGDHAQGLFLYFGYTGDEAHFGTGSGGSIQMRDA